MSESRRCQTCKFHDTIVGGDKAIVTVCRRKAPQVLATFVNNGSGLQVVQSNLWPNMKPEDWCGEYEAQLH